MTNKMKLLIGLLSLGIILVGGGTLFLLHPLMHLVETTGTPQLVSLPDETPVVAEELNYVMRGENDSLSIYTDSSVFYIEEKGLRMPTPGDPATRTWKTGKLTPEELNSLMDYLDNSGFEKLNEYYQFPGKPIEGGTSVAITSGDGSFKFKINSARIQKIVTASGYLTPDHDETYPEIPSPLNEIYRRLRIIALSTQEVAKENIQ
jgi:hypothetical protein